jgi:DNA-binding response OmpR family regulator
MQPSDPYRIAFIEPTASGTAHLRQLLEFEGITVFGFGPDELHRVRELRADLVVMNQGALRGRTLAVSAALGGDLAPRPLTLALVGPGDELSGIELVERGLDAYIVTSCGCREFVARVRALLRRARRPGQGEAATVSPAGPARSVRFSDLHIDPPRRTVQLQGRPLRFTEQEFRLLYFLAGNPGRVFDRQALLDAVWGNETFVTTRSVDALVKRVRQQLRGAGRGDVSVETVRGVGYRLAGSGLRASTAA